MTLNLRHERAALGLTLDLPDFYTRWITIDGWDASTRFPDGVRVLLAMTPIRGMGLQAGERMQRVRSWFFLHNGGVAQVARATVS